MSEDADGPAGAAGRDAEFTLNVDGQQIGGLQTVTASRAAGQTQTFTFQGNFAPGAHNVTVTFANNSMTQGDKAAFNDGGDRNLYVNSVTYNGGAVTTGTTPIYTSPLFPPNGPLDLGHAVFKVNDTTPIPANAPSTPTTTPAAVMSGSGNDTLTLAMSEDPYLGDAQFTVSVDGTQVGGTFTTSAVAWQGQQQQFVLKGNWGSGTHAVKVAFTNDAVTLNSDGYGIDALDRNLYINGVTYDGGTASGTPWELASNGSQTFNVTAITTPTPTPTPTPTDTLVLKLSEDAYQGDAQYTVSVNGKPIGGARTATATHAAGQSSTVSLTGSFGLDPTVVVTFTNDAYGGAGADRNLYVDGVTYDGVVQAASGALYSNGSMAFALTNGPKTAILPNASVKLVDDKGATALIKVITSGTQVTHAGVGNSLDGDVTQNINSLGVAQILGTTFGKGVVSASLVDTGGASYHIGNIRTTTVELGGATAGVLSEDGAAGGSIKLDSGKYTVNVAAEAWAGGTAAQNRFTVSMAGGTHSLLIDDSATGGVSSNVVTTGAGSDRMTFISAKSNTVTAGSGTATVLATSGTNSFTAGTGTLDVTGGSGPNAYVFHATGGLLKIEDFSLAKGDTLTMDKALQAKMTQTSDGHGGLMIGFGTAGHGIDLVNVTSLQSSQVRFV
jgi:hypothetical protein